MYTPLRRHTATQKHKNRNNICVLLPSPSSVEQMLLLENKVQTYHRRTLGEDTAVPVGLLAAAGTGLVTFSFLYDLQKALGQPDSLECSLAG